MHDRVPIYTGLAVFLGAVTFPIWFNLASGVSSKGPEPRRPTAEKQCVAPVEYMRQSHMDLLIAWRDQAVRLGDKRYVAFNGKHYTVGLTATCMNCHTDKAEFCDRCHNYAAATLTCWDCHVDPKLAARPQVASAAGTPGGTR